MDDLQFRRSIYADPQSRDEDLLAAINADPAKQKFAQDIDLLDQKIAQALNVDVPNNLCENLILRQTLASHQQQKKKKRVHLALAASIAVAFGLTINMLQFSNAYTSMGDYAIAHVHHEAGYFSNEDEANISLASLNNKMSSFQGTFTQNVGELISADYCRFDGMKSLHLVFKGSVSPVTVFVIPKNDHLKYNESFSGDSLKGSSHQFEDANIIIVGDSKEPLQKWQQDITKNIRWST